MKTQSTTPEGVLSTTTESLKLSFVCVDTETTGLDDSAEIIEIGMVKIIDGIVADRYSQLIRPYRPIPEEITQLTGIDNDMVEHQPHWNDVEAAILDFIGDFTLVAHNVSFDRSMIENHIGRVLPNAWLDTHDVAKIFMPSLTSYKLISIAGALQIAESGFHRAVNDAEVTAQVLLTLTAKACEADPFTLQKIIAVFEGESCGLVTWLQAVQSYIVAHASVGKTYQIKEPEKVYGKKPLLTFAEASRFFEDGGLMAQASEDFQHRPQQIKMQKMISNAFMNENHGIIEAGTGTGKSFAYLLPALLWAYENQCRVLVSTNTIALQEQLYHKDIPFLKECLDFNFPVALSKGRSNYLCMRRFEQYQRQANTVMWSEKIFIAQLIYWLTLTEHGDKETLNLNKLENQFWASVASQSETCLGNQCSMARNCFYMNNRKACENSMLIITNHALLLQNIKLDNQILPSHEHIIVDEAHNLEDEATRQFTDTVDLEFLRKTANHLLRSNSIVNRIINKVREFHEESEAYGELLLAQRTLTDDIAVLESHIKSAIDYVFTVPMLAHNNEWRITAKERKANWWNDFYTQLSHVKEMTMTVFNRLSHIRNRIDVFEDLDLLAKELVFNQSFFGEQYKYIETFLEEKRKNDIYWISYTKSSWGTNLSLCVAPIDVMPLLKERLFENNKSVILTSATLAVADDLKYTAQLYLLDEEEYVSYITPSPFDYAKQSCIAIPTDIADYSQVSEETYSRMLIESLEQIIHSVTGGILILFTSYAMLNKTYFALKHNPNLSDYNILAHGQDGNRTSILQSLNKTDNTIVLGANSFWEGVDIKGTGLTTLIITKLPFQPPTKPITSAKMEYITAQGKNSFAAYSLPQAVLKFRQGCGRLIRSMDDWGTIIILDKRVLTKGYGKDFINSLPKQPIIRKPLAEVCEKLSIWMQKKSKQK
ncbi:MAG: DEAD/DEAH box helicase [Peptococcaceae bacterium]|nr:DEAD/DEAH box helicase [Peptococcaceae bacterium]